MKRFRNIISIIVILVMCFGFIPSVNAQITQTEGFTPAIKQVEIFTPEIKQADIFSAGIKTAVDWEATYGITVKDPSKLLKTAQGKLFLEVLEKTMKKYSASFARKLAEKYSEYNAKIYVEIKKPTAKIMKDYITGMAEWDGKTAKITVYTKKGNYRGGVDVETLSHEYGHLIHFMLEEEYSASKIKTAWVKKNGKKKYDNNLKNNGKTFIDNYGSTNFYEDVAATFEYLASKSKTFLNKYKDSSYSAIKGKMKLLSGWVEKYIGTPGKLFTPVLG